MCATAVLASLASTLVFAQSPAVRIASEINNSEMTVLRGSQLPLANPQFDAGRMPAATRLNGITVYFSRSAAQQADLAALIAAQQNPASPLYHQWLTPDQFAARFGMAAQDIDAAQSWLQQQGFSIDSVNRSRNAIHFSGSVGMVESAFQTQMHFYTVNGVKHFAPSTALSVPAALAPVVLNVGNLSDFRPHPMHITPRARPGFTSSQSGSVFFAPGDIVTTYDLKPLYSGGDNGAGQTIAIMGQSYINVVDMENFETAAGLPKKDPTLVLVPGTGNDGTTVAGDESESDLDIEWSGAMAPGANVNFVYTGSNTNYGVFDSAAYAVDQRIGNIISISYSDCEPQLTQATVSQWEAVFQQATVQGQTVMSASGDSGSTACSGYTNLSAAQQEVEAVNYPASSAYVTAVGGTEISVADDSENNSTYWVAATSTGSDVLTSAKTYIPEIAWNDDSSQNGLSASGGGPSSLVARPSWQSGGPGIPSGSMRLVPDIAF
jgi:subtilase family serine protease